MAEAASSPAPTGPRRWGEVWARLTAHWAAFPVAVFAVSRVALLGFSSMALRMVPTLYHQGGARDVPGSFLRQWPSLDGLCRWDCGLYEKISRQGYTEALDGNVWPLLGALTRLLSEATGIHPHLALLLLPNLACLAAYLVIYRLFLHFGDDDVEGARWGLMLFAVYPFAFFHAAGYPESMMVLSTSGALLLAVRGRHLSAGAALGLGLLARHLSVIGGTALLVAQLRERPSVRRFLWSPSLLGLGLPFLFLGGYMVFLGRQLGDPLAWLHARQLWGPGAWQGVWEIVLTRSPFVFAWLYILFSLIPGLGAVLLCLRPKWAELAAFAVALMAVNWAVGAAGLGRYSAAVWPSFLPLGLWLAKRRHLQAPVVAALALFQGMFFWLFVHQYNIL